MARLEETSSVFTKKVGAQSWAEHLVGTGCVMQLGSSRMASCCPLDLSRLLQPSVACCRCSHHNGGGQRKSSALPKILHASTVGSETGQHHIWWWKPDRRRRTASELAVSLQPVSPLTWVHLHPEWKSDIKKKVWEIKWANNQATEKMRLGFHKLIQVGNYSDR